MIDLSRNKKRRIPVTKSELTEQLREQISFLLTSSEIYDNGQIHEGKRLAHTLRLLLCDVGSSKSLLGQLELKKNRFLNTASPYKKDSLVSYAGLILFRFENSVGRKPWVVAKGTPDQMPKKSKLLFSDWWNMPVIITGKSKSQIKFSRRDVVLHVANTDGGSHVDDALNKEYVALSKWNEMGIYIIENGNEIPMGNPILPCIRQISHEIIT